MTKLVPLTQDKVACVDDQDHEFIAQWKWHFNKLGYAERRVWAGNGESYLIKMHMQIMGATKFLIDHIDGDGLNNQKANLRFCTSTDNARNSKSRKDKTSKYKGVYFFKSRKNWVAKITVNYKTIHIGYFQSEIDAALAYNKAAIAHHKEFAKLNIIVP